MEQNTQEVVRDADTALRSTFDGLVTWERLAVVGIVIATIFIILSLADKFINRQLNQDKIKEMGSYNRIVTVAYLIRRIIKIVLMFIGITIIMSVFNISIAPILATLGVFLLAIGVGAQDLVKDLINGFFIIFEDQYAVGDLVTIKGITGIVEYLGLRVTKIRDFSKVIHIIPNSKIEIVANKQRGEARGLIDFYIDNSENPEQVQMKIEKALEKFSKDEKMVRGPIFWGVTENASDYYKMTLVFFTKQGDQYDLEYAIRSTILKTMQDENIKTPRIKNEIWR